MKVFKVENNTNFQQTKQSDNKKPKREFIDKLSDAVTNPRDVNDCVAVPRGIFKAYLLLMAGTGIIAIANLLPEQIKKIKFSGTKKAMCITGWVLNTLSAWFFAKGFAIKGLNPTVNRDEYKKQHS